MIGRVRNLSTNTHYICLQGSPLNLPVEIQEIRKVIYDKRNNLYKKIDSLHFEYEDDGGIKFHETKFFNLFLESSGSDLTPLNMPPELSSNLRSFSESIRFCR